MATLSSSHKRSKSISDPMTLFIEHLKRWPIEPTCSLVPVSRSENLVFRVRDGDEKLFVLRLHRPGYRSEREIRSELDWIQALGRDTPVLVPEIVPTRGGDVLAPLTVAGEAVPRFAVLFVEHQGELPDETDPRLPVIFETLGETAALCHLHVSGWTLPADFSRPSWTITDTLGSQGIWGDWRLAPDLSAADRGVLEQAQARLEALYDRYGTPPNRFGLIHNDMRPSNFLWHEDKLRLLDFDDCGFAWFIADFAASVSWFEDDPRVPALFAHWRTGYERYRHLSADDVAMAGPALMARRLLLLAWSATRADTDLASAYAKGFTQRTVALARRFLDEEGLV